MEATAEKKKSGNPNFSKKTEFDYDQEFEFELVQSHERYQPKDLEGRPYDDPYPPILTLPNEGTELDEATGKKRNWRFLTGEDSIWCDEQSVNNLSKKEIDLMLARDENRLVFIRGKLRVKAYDTAKLAALKIMSMYEGKKVRLNNAMPVYRLLNPETILDATIDVLDKAFEAESAAREASIDEIKMVAVSLGINMNQSDKSITKDFILAAKANPTFFLKQFVNPKNKFIYAFKNALEDGKISFNAQPNKLIWVESNAVIIDVNSNGDVPEELATKALMDDPTVIKLFNQLSKL